MALEKPKASVYIDLEDNQELISATNDAIEAWNKTDAFIFTKASSRKKPILLLNKFIVLTPTMLVTPLFIIT
ncbi:hypothetical protein SDC49_09225 [Lactobacillus sp. R2/2]|nr:hypothetical protein [Lactobacillus sp. R2/2]